MNWVCFGLLTASLLLSGCITRLSVNQVPQKTVLRADRVEVPATFISKRPAIDLMINGKGPYRFLVDTGADGNSISRRVAREAGISVSEKITSAVFGASADYKNLPMAMVRRIEGEGFSLQGIAVVVWPSAGAWGEGVEGIIGISTLGDMVLELDYPRQKIHFSRPGAAEVPSSAGIPYTGLRPRVTLAISAATNSTIVAEIDTGADGYFVLEDIRCFPVRGGLVRNDFYVADVGGGTTRPLYGQLLGEISCGPAIWRDPTIAESRRNRIGSDALEKWKLVIDQKQKLLWLEGEKDMVVVTNWVGPVESDGRPAVYGFACVADGDAFLVKEVDAGSRAERAGLRVGDRFTFEAVDRNPETPEEGRDSFAMRLRVMRESERLEMVLSLREPLRETAPGVPGED